MPKKALCHNICYMFFLILENLTKDRNRTNAKRFNDTIHACTNDINDSVTLKEIDLFNAKNEKTKIAYPKNGYKYFLPKVFVITFNPTVK